MEVAPVYLFNQKQNVIQLFNVILSNSESVSPSNMFFHVYLCANKTNYIYTASSCSQWCTLA